MLEERKNPQTIVGIVDAIQPRQTLALRIHCADGTDLDQPVILRIDTPIEIEYCKHGGILPFVLTQIAQPKQF